MYSYSYRRRDVVDRAEEVRHAYGDIRNTVLGLYVNDVMQSFLVCERAFGSRFILAKKSVPLGFSGSLVGHLRVLGLQK